LELVEFLERRFSIRVQEADVTLRPMRPLALAFGR